MHLLESFFQWRTTVLRDEEVLEKGDQVESIY